MKKIFFLFLLISFLIENTSVAHIKHYNNIKYLKYNIYFNDDYVGFHILNFKRNGNYLEVKGNGNFSISKLGIDLINYKTSTSALYKDNQLIKFNSETLQNDKKKYVNVELEDNSLLINGSSYNGKAEKDLMMSSLWNHEIIKKKQQISSVSGRVINQKVNFLGKKKILINNQSYNAINFHIFSDNDKSMNKKKINIKIWYDTKTLLWLKASYKKFGNLEYRLDKVKY